MKFIIAIILLTGFSNLYAQGTTANDKVPQYALHLTTVNDNVLKGLLLQVKDSSIWIYPGNRKEWKNDIRYKPVAFDYSRIHDIKLKRKNDAFMGSWSRKKFTVDGNEALFNTFQKEIQINCQSK